jgi:DNA-binding MarR family transcriptional regulator
MSRDLRENAELSAALGMAFRKLSAATIMFHQTIADRLGLNVTDHKCVDILVQNGPVTAGALAERTGLTTGAITGVIDRLEKAGFARRVRDPRDRRRVLVEPIMKQVEKRIFPLFESMAQATAELCSRFSPHELAVIQDFAARACEMAHEETRKIRTANCPAEKSGRNRP